MHKQRLNWLGFSDVTVPRRPHNVGGKGGKRSRAPLPTGQKHADIRLLLLWGPSQSIALSSSSCINASNNIVLGLPRKLLEDQEQCYWMHWCKKMKRVRLITQSWKKRHMTEKLGVNEKEPAFGQKTPTTTWGPSSRVSHYVLAPSVRPSVRPSVSRNCHSMLTMTMMMMMIINRSLSCTHVIYDFVALHSVTNNSNNSIIDWLTQSVCFWPSLTNRTYTELPAYNNDEKGKKKGKGGTFV